MKTALDKVAVDTGDDAALEVRQGNWTEELKEHIDWSWDHSPREA